MTSDLTRDNSRRGFLQSAAGLAGAAPFAPLLAAASAQAAEAGQLIDVSGRARGG